MMCLLLNELIFRNMAHDQNMNIDSPTSLFREKKLLKFLIQLFDNHSQYVSADSGRKSAICFVLVDCHVFVKA